MPLNDEQRKRLQNGCCPDCGGELINVWGATIYQKVDEVTLYPNGLVEIDLSSWDSEDVIANDDRRDDLWCANCATTIATQSSEREGNAYKLTDEYGG